MISILLILLASVSNLNILLRTFNNFQSNISSSKYLTFVMRNIGRNFNIITGIHVIIILISFDKFIQNIIYNLNKFDKIVYNKNNRFYINLILTIILFLPVLCQTIYIFIFYYKQFLFDFKIFLAPFLFQFLTVFELLFFILNFELCSRIKLINKLIQKLNLKSNNFTNKKMIRLKIGYLVLINIHCKISDRFSLVLFFQLSQCFICVVYMCVLSLDDLLTCSLSNIFQCTSLFIYIYNYGLRFFLLTFACDQIYHEVSCFFLTFLYFDGLCNEF
jgi:hypothetical protein